MHTAPMSGYVEETALSIACTHGYRDVCTLLEPGGVIIGNLFNGEKGNAAGDRLEAFLAQLRKALGKGGEVTRLVVEGQEMNVVIRARKAGGQL